MRQRLIKATLSIKPSLCMIVKNEERFLEGFIAAHRQFFNDWVIVDTGSSDSSCDIIKRAGLSLYQFEWCDDFAAARNYALSLCQGPWIACLDADEIIDEFSQQQLLHYMQRDDIDGYEVDIKNYIAEGHLLAHCPDYVIEYHAPDGSYTKAVKSDEDYGYRTTKLIRIFRKDRGFHWESPVHEVLTRTASPSHGKVGHIDGVCIHHLGMLDWDGKAASKRQLYQRIANSIRTGQEVAGHPKLLFEASRFIEDPSERAILLQKALAQAPRDITLLKELAHTCLKGGNGSLAQETCQKMIEYYPEMLDGYLAAARCHQECGELSAALLMLKKQLVRFRNNAMFNYTLATLHAKAGQWTEAASYAGRAAQQSPLSPMIQALHRSLSAMLKK